MTTSGTPLTANDWDPAGSAITTTLVANPANGSVSNFGTDGTFTFTPNMGFTGFDSFTYQVSNGSESSDPVEVTIAVGIDFTAQTNADRLGPGSLLGDGTVQFAEPLTAGLGLLYNSATVVDPIVAVDAGLQSSASVPSSIDAELTFGGTAGSTYAYSTSSLNAGDSFRIAVAAPASSLETGRYAYTLKATANGTSGSVDHNYTGYYNLVRRNSSSELFGAGWQLTGVDALDTNETGGVLWVRDNGAAYWFADNGSGGYLQADGDNSLSTLVKNGDNTFTLTDKYGDQINFDTAGKITSRVDTNGNTTSYTWDANDELTKITDPFSRDITIAYTGGRATTITDFANRATTLEYSASGELTKITLPDPDGGGPLTAVTQFGYGSGNTPSGLVDSRTDSGGDVTTYAYADNRLATITHPDAATWQLSSPITAGLPTGSSGNVLGKADPKGQITHERGKIWQFRTDRFGSVTYWQDPLGNESTWERNLDGFVVRETLADPDGPTEPEVSPVTVFGYSIDNDLVYRKDPDGNTATWTFNSSNLPTSFTDELSRTTNLAYDSSGNVTSVTDPLGNATTYAYNSQGFVTSITYPDPDGAGSLPSPQLSFVYDADHRRTSRTESNGGKTQWAYDKVGRVTEITLPDPDGTGGVSAPVYAYEFNDQGLLKKITDPLGNATTYQYATSALVTSITDAQSNQTDYAYDDMGRVLSVTAPDPDGAGPLTAPVTTYLYDGFDRLTSVTDAAGGITTYGFDDNGNLISLKDALGNETTFGYDGLDRLTLETDALGNARSYDYDLVGNMSRYQDRNERVLRFAFDDLDRLIREDWRSGATPAPTLAIDTLADGDTTDEVQTVGFEASFGQLTGGTFTLTFNSQTTSALAYNASAATVQSALEGLSSIGSGNVSVTKTSDSTSSQMWKLTFQGSLADTDVGQTTIDASSVTTDMGPGNLTETEATDTAGGVATNEKQKVTLTGATGGTFRLALDGYVTAAIAYNATTSEVETALESLGSVDDVTVTGNAGGPWTVEFVGNQAGSAVSEMGGDVTGATAGTLVRSINYTLDEVGRLTAASDPDSSYAYTFDALDRVLTVDNNGTAGVPRVILTNTYDANGDRTGLSATIDGVADFVNSYTFDKLRRLTRLDQTGQAGGNSVAEKRVDFEFNALGQYTSVTRYTDTDGLSANKVMTSTYQYDSLGRLTNLDYKRSAGTDIVTPFTWTYDNLSTPGLPAAGTSGVSLPGDPRVAATAVLSTSLGSGRITQMTGEDGTIDYGYDSTSQLVSADYSDPSLTDESYTFDAVGNRTMTGYQTGTANRLLNDGTYSYEYDDEGNRTKRTKTSTSEVTEYTWDYRNRLTKVTEKDGSGNVTKVVEYTYDLFNRKIGKEVDTTSPFDMQDAAIERYVYEDGKNGIASLDGGDVVFDFVDADGPGGSGAMTLEKRYFRGNRVDELFAQEDVTKSLTATDRVLWQVVDHLSTVRALVNQDGNAATKFVYDAFGGIVSGDTSLTRYLFTSREFDVDTGLQYNRARWYDANVGRWISEDPLGFAAGDVNTARYVGNGVVGERDETGLSRSKKRKGGSGPSINDIAEQMDDPKHRGYFLIIGIQGDNDHAWVGVVDSTRPGNPIVDTIGFGPAPKTDPVNNNEVPGRYASESDRGTDYRKIYPISATEYNRVRADIKARLAAPIPPKYDMADNNCAHCVQDVVEQNTRIGLRADPDDILSKLPEQRGDNDDPHSDNISPRTLRDFLKQGK